MTEHLVKVPKELLGVNATALEDYVRGRLLQFIKRFGVSLSQLLPGVTPILLDRAVHQTLRTLPLPDYGQVPLEKRQLQLVFRHDCQALGCLEPQCPLCQHNSKRRCTVNFSKKYLVNDRMVARCGAPIRIEVIDRATGRLCDSDLSDIFFEVFILNGATYDQYFLDAARSSALSRADSSNPDSVAILNRDLDSCALLANNKGKPLLASLTGGKTTDDGKLLVQTVRGRVVLPDLTVTDSSEALLSGRKPPFRLVVRARHKHGRHIPLRPAVSEAFVVATRRVRTSHKADIPTMDDSIAKLLHMGKETCRKLADLHVAARQANIDLELERNLACVEKVGDFKALAVRAEADAQLRQQLQTLLKLPKDKWDECVEHAKRAVFPDNRTRAWMADKAGTLGLLFSASLGVMDLQRPEALLQYVTDPTGTGTLQVVHLQQQTPAQRDLVRQLLPQAEECWWSQGHTGWTLFDQESLSAAPLLQGQSLLVSQSPTLSTMAHLTLGSMTTPLAAVPAAIPPTAVPAAAPAAVPPAVPPTAVPAAGQDLLGTPLAAAPIPIPACLGTSPAILTPQLLQNQLPTSSMVTMPHSTSHTAPAPATFTSPGTLAAATMLPPIAQLTTGTLACLHDTNDQQQQLLTFAGVSAAQDGAYGVNNFGSAGMPPTFPSWIQPPLASPPYTPADQAAQQLHQRVPTEQLLAPGAVQGIPGVQTTYTTGTLDPAAAAAGVLPRGMLDPAAAAAAAAAVTPRRMFDPTAAAAAVTPRRMFDPTAAAAAGVTPTGPPAVHAHNAAIDKVKQSGASDTCMVETAAAGTRPRPAAMPSAFAALAAQPITAGESPPTSQTRVAHTAADAPSTAAAANPAANLAANTAAEFMVKHMPASAVAHSAEAGLPAGDRQGNAQGSADRGGLSSSPRKSHSSGGSWLPPLSGRKRPHTPSGPVDISAAGRLTTGAPAGLQLQGLPASQLSADMDRLLSAVGFQTSLPGALRDTPSLAAYPSLGSLLDTTHTAGAAGGVSGASAFPVSTVPRRTASVGLSTLLSLDLGLMLRGTSLLPLGHVASATAGGHGHQHDGSPAGGQTDAEGHTPATGGAADDGGLPTPHAAAAAEGLMALSDPMLGASQP